MSLFPPPPMTSFHTDLIEDNTVDQVQAGQTHIGEIVVSNPNTSDVFLQLFDATKVTVDADGLGTYVPTLSYACIAGGGATARSNSVVIGKAGGAVRFNTALSFAITTTRTGSTAPTLDCEINILYR
jgi:hypothetical protein